MQAQDTRGAAVVPLRRYQQEASDDSSVLAEAEALELVACGCRGANARLQGAGLGDHLTALADSFALFARALRAGEDREAPALLLSASISYLDAFLLEGSYLADHYMRVGADLQEAGEERIA